MMQHLVIIGLIAGCGLFLWAGIHFGSKWIDRKLGVWPPIDPSKPIVRQRPEGE